MKAILDTETGGFSITKNGICEIGIIVVNEKLEFVDEIQVYIKPYTREEGSEELVSYKEGAMEVNGLSEEFLIENGIDVIQATKEIVNFINSYKISKFIGHNIKFDTKRVQYLADRFCSEDLTYIEEIDTLKMAKEKIKVIKNHKLGTVCDHFEVEHEDSHTALGDCLATLEVYKKLL